MYYYTILILVYFNKFSPNFFRNDWSLTENLNKEQTTVRSRTSDGVYLGYSDQTLSSRIYQIGVRVLSANSTKNVQSECACVRTCATITNSKSPTHYFRLLFVLILTLCFVNFYCVNLRVVCFGLIDSGNVIFGFRLQFVIFFLCYLIGYF